MYVCGRMRCLSWIGDVVIRRSLLMFPLCMCVEGCGVCLGLVWLSVDHYDVVVCVCMCVWKGVMFVLDWLCSYP